MSVDTSLPELFMARVKMSFTIGSHPPHPVPAFKRIYMYTQTYRRAKKHKSCVSQWPLYYTHTEVSDIESFTGCVSILTHQPAQYAIDINSCEYIATTRNIISTSRPIKIRPMWSPIVRAAVRFVRNLWDWFHAHGITCWWYYLARKTAASPPHGIVAAVSSHLTGEHRKCCFDMKLYR